MTTTRTIRFREILDEEHLFEYSDFTERFIDVRYPLEYLKRSRVIALVIENFNGDIDKIIGGYIIAPKPPFRVIEQLPAQVVAGHAELQKYRHKCLELTGLWMHPHIRGGRLRFRLWWKLLTDLLGFVIQGKSHFVYSYDAANKKLGEMYSLSNPSRIFEGTVYIKGMSGVNREIVEMGSTLAVLLAFFSSPLRIGQFICRRLFRRKNIFRKAIA
jgi:hypothetical protein